MQVWSEIILVISNRTSATRSFDFEITRMISDQIDQVALLSEKESEECETIAQYLQTRMSREESRVVSSSSSVSSSSTGNKGKDFVFSHSMKHLTF